MKNIVRERLLSKRVSPAPWRDVSIPLLTGLRADLNGAEEEVIRLSAINAELLAALQQMIESVDCHKVTIGDCNQARAAISRATGGGK